MIALGGLVASLVVAAAHIGFMVLESVLWTKPTGRKIFAQSKEDAEKTKVLAQNQGVYNGALALLLAWAALSGLTSTVAAVLVFIVVVGIFGAVTAKPTILFLQAIPAGLALALVLLGV